MAAKGAGADQRGTEAGFGGPQVCKIVGISYRQLDYWARTGPVSYTHLTLPTKA